MLCMSASADSGRIHAQMLTPVQLDTVGPGTPHYRRGAHLVTCSI